MRSITIVLLLLSTFASFSQGSTGIGINYPTKAKLEIYGGAGALARNMAAFGSEGAGVMIQSNPPTIGFNVFDTMTTDKISLFKFNSSGSLSYNLQSYNGNSSLSNIQIQNDGNVIVGAEGSFLTSLYLYLNNNSTYHNSPFAQFVGSMFSSNFGIYSSRINGGKLNSKVIINDIPLGKILIGGKATFNGDLLPSTTLSTGIIALTKRDEHNICSSSIFIVGNTSYVNVVRTGCGNSSKAFELSNGNVEGQLLIIQIEGNNDFTIYDTGNVELQGNIQLGGGDILMLMWNAPINKWIQLSYSNN